MNPLDLEKRVPRGILEELIEEGTEAFRGILEKLFNVAMQLDKKRVHWEPKRTREPPVGEAIRNGFKEKRIQTRVGELGTWRIPQVRGLRFYPKSLERGCRSEKALKLAICRDAMCMGVSTRKVTEIDGAAVWVGDLGHPSLESGRDSWTKCWSSFEAGSWESIRSCI